MITMNVWASITAFARQLAEEITVAQIGQPRIFDFEAHANVQELPNQDLIGPVSAAIEETSSGLFAVNFSIGLATINDANLFRHRRMIARIFEAMRPERSIEIFDAENSQSLGWMKIVDGTVLMPVANASVRAFQYVQADGLLDPRFASPS